MPDLNARVIYTDPWDADTPHERSRPGILTRFEYNAIWDSTVYVVQFEDGTWVEQDTMEGIEFASPEDLERWLNA